MRNQLLSHLVLSVIVVSASVFVGLLMLTSASLAEDVVYPVVELGNCRDKSECKSFCDQPQNFRACIDFAEKHNLVPSEELQGAKKFLEVGEGPGGCETPSACKSYCDDVDNIDECIAYAQEHGIIPPEELEEARKVQAALRSGARLPGGCRSKAECENYCNDASHMEECIAFAEAAGFIPPGELAEAKRVLQAVKKGIKPPNCGSKKACDIYCSQPQHAEECITFGEAAGLIPAGELENARKTLAAIRKGVMPPNCQGKEACDVYCSQPQHMEECVTFGIAAGFIPPEELENAQRTLKAIKKGVKPPNCQGKEACDVYCSQDEHAQECINFAEAAGFMTSEEAAMARKTGGKGPGGCRGKEECDQFCQNPANQETCFNFAKEHGLISESDLKKMEEGMRMLRDSLNQAPSQVLECLYQNVGREVIERIRAGGMPPQNVDMGKEMERCVRSMGPPQGPPQEGMPPPGEGVPGMPPGPGGCVSQEECARYCSDPAHREECEEFLSRPVPFGSPGVGPSPEEYIPAGPPEGFSPPPEYVPPPAEYVPPPTEPIPPPPSEPTPTEPTPTEPTPTEQPTSLIDLFLGIILYPVDLLLR